MEIQNIDKYLPKQDDRVIVNPYAPLPCHHVLYVGGTGSGKTSVLMNLILQYLYYDQIYLFAKDLHEPKYEFLQNYINQLESDVNQKIKKTKGNKATEIKIGHFSDSLDKIPDINTFDRKKQYLFVFDDFLTAKNQESIKDLIIRCRKHGISLHYLSQSLFKTPKLIRDNVQYVLVWNNGNRRELQQIATSYACRVPYKIFIKACEEVFNSGNRFTFITIDTVTPNLLMHIRNGFDKPIKVIQDYINDNKVMNISTKKPKCKSKKYESVSESYSDEL